MSRESENCNFFRYFALFLLASSTSQSTIIWTYTMDINPMEINPTAPRLPLGWDRHTSSSGRIYYRCRSTEHVQWHYPTQREVENPVEAAERAKKNMEAEKEKAKQKTVSKGKEQAADAKAKSAGEEEKQDEAMEIFASYKFVDVKPFGKGRLAFLRPTSIEVKYPFGKILVPTVGASFELVTPSVATVQVGGSLLRLTNNIEGSKVDPDPNLTRLTDNGEKGKLWTVDPGPNLTRAVVLLHRLLISPLFLAEPYNLRKRKDLDKSDTEEEESDEEVESEEEEDMSELDLALARRCYKVGPNETWQDCDACAAGGTCFEDDELNSKNSVRCVLCALACHKACSKLVAGHEQERRCCDACIEDNRPMVENGIVHFDPSLECYAKEVEHLLTPKLLFVSHEVFEERMYELYGDNEGNAGQKVNDFVPNEESEDDEPEWQPNGNDDDDEESESYKGDESDESRK